jgi:hypothetical protein
MNLENRITQLEKAAFKPASGSDMTLLSEAELEAMTKPTAAFPYDVRRLTDDELIGIDAALSRTVSGKFADAVLSPELEAAMERVRVTL